MWVLPLIAPTLTSATTQSPDPGGAALVSRDAFFFFFLVALGFELGFTLARQVLYHLRYYQPSCCFVIQKKKGLGLCSHFISTGPMTLGMSLDLPSSICVFFCKMG
jgi:hypothetical protein